MSSKSGVVSLAVVIDNLRAVFHDDAEIARTIQTQSLAMLRIAHEDCHEIDPNRPVPSKSIG